MFSKKRVLAKSKSLIKNIITIDAYSDKYYIFKSNLFKPLKKLSYNTSNFVASYLSSKDLVTTIVNLSRTIPEEDIADTLYIKVYEELGLDQTQEYVINYYEVESTGEEREFHVFVVQHDLLENLFASVAEETKYIDLVVPAPLLYKPLYDREILTNQGTHCFVYFAKEDAFIAIYHNGEYLYSKSIEFSLDAIYQRYCEMVGEKVDEEAFYNVLATEGLKSTKEQYHQTFMKIFGEIYIAISDIIIYTKRAYQLETIDQLYIGSSYGPIMGLDEYSQNYLGLKSFELNFDYGIKSDEWYIDQLHWLMLLNAFGYMEDEASVVNLTTFPRPPSFVNRASGQFIIAVFAAIVLGLAYPIAYLVGYYTNSAKTAILKVENNKLTAEANRYKRVLKEKREKIKGLNEKIGRLSDTYEAKAKTLTAVHDKKVNYRLKSDTLYTIAEDLGRFDVHVEKIVTAGNTVWLSLVSEDDRKLTELIKYIANRHHSEIKEIDIESIEEDPHSNYFKGVLKVVLK